MAMKLGIADSQGRSARDSTKAVVAPRDRSDLENKVRLAATWYVAGKDYDEIAEEIGGKSHVIRKYRDNYPDMWYGAVEQATEKMLPGPRDKALKYLQGVIDGVEEDASVGDKISAARAILGHYEKMTQQSLRVEHTGRDGGPIQQERIALDVIIEDPESYQLAKQLARRHAGVPGSGDDGDDTE